MRLPLRNRRVIGGILLLQMKGVSVEFGLRLRCTQSRTQSGDSAGDKPLRANRRLGKGSGGKATGDPNLYVVSQRSGRMPKLGRHNSNNRVQVSVEAEAGS